MAKDKRRSYGNYITEIDGKKYAVAYLPEGGGRYKRKVKLLSKLPPEKNSAKKWALHQLDKSDQRNHPKDFSAVADWYQQEYLVPPQYKDGKKVAGLRTWKNSRSVLSRLTTEFGDYGLDELTVDVLARYKSRELKRVSISTVNRRFSMLNTIFKKARHREWMTKDPFGADTSLLDIALETKRDSQVTDRVVKRLLARSRKSRQKLLYYLIMVLANTGGRPSEVFPFQRFKYKDMPLEPLNWKRVLKYDFKAVELVSYKGRIRKTRLVPASEALEVALRKFHSEVQPDEEDLLFNVGSFNNAWYKLRNSIGMPAIRMRDLRHYFNTYMVNRSDLNDMERMLIMGQTQLSTNARYSKLDITIVDKFRRK